MATDKRQGQLEELTGDLQKTRTTIDTATKHATALESRIKALKVEILLSLAAEYGVASDELAEKAYIDPADPFNPKPWNGLGRQPKWLKAKLKAGHTKDEYIKK